MLQAWGVDEAWCGVNHKEPSFKHENDYCANGGEAMENLHFIGGM